jgi:rare lipoprotein A (peptidoglycan hydrolase)
MKEKYLLLSAMLLFASCGNQHYVKNQKSGSKFSHLEQVNKKQISKRKTPPTEEAQGLNTGILYSNQPDFDDEKRDEKEIANSFITDDGGYIGQYKVGNQYEVDGVEYQPQKYENFEEVGKASWYGDDFHGRKTANGETYHMGDMTAAHPTLPLPSMVRITNLDNDKSVKVRVNDRGPFSKKRVVDVSEKAARELGFKDKGTANVKVEFLKDDTEMLLKKLKIDKN